MSEPTPPHIAHALSALAAQDERLAALIDKHGAFTPRRADSPDAFAALARAIIFQQLAGKAAASIHRRFCALVDGQVRPSRVGQLSLDQLRSAGLSASKALAVADLVQCAQAGALELSTLDALSDEALTDHLCQVRGVGPWTAQMFMLFELGRLDIWPTGDLAVRRGFSSIYGLEPAVTARQLEPLGDPFRPYRSIVAWYCWRVMDTP